MKYGKTRGLVSSVIWFISAILMIGTVACSLESRERVSVRVDLAELKGNNDAASLTSSRQLHSSRSGIDLEAEITDAAPVLGELYSSSLPEVLDNFKCFAVNITGPGIQPSVSPDFVNAQTATPDQYCTYPGATSKLISQVSGSLGAELKVPTGPSRIVQIVGVLTKDNPEECPTDLTLSEWLLQKRADMLAGKSAPAMAFVELGKSGPVDLYRDQAVEVQNQYKGQADARKAFYCGEAWKFGLAAVTVSPSPTPSSSPTPIATHTVVPAPSTPTGLKFSVDANTPGFRLNWNPATNATKYKVEKTCASSGTVTSYQDVTTTYAAIDCDYSSCTTACSFNVTAFNANGDSSAPSAQILSQFPSSSSQQPIIQISGLTPIYKNTCNYMIINIIDNETGNNYSYEALDAAVASSSVELPFGGLSSASGCSETLQSYITLPSTNLGGFWLNPQDNANTIKIDAYAIINGSIFIHKISFTTTSL